MKNLFLGFLLNATPFFLSHLSDSKGRGCFISLVQIRKKKTINNTLILALSQAKKKGKEADSLSGSSTLKKPNKNLVYYFM